MRKILSVTTAVLIVAGLAACSGSGSPAPSATSASASCQNTKAGSASKSVKVTGEFGQTPTVAFTTPLRMSDAERSVVIEGKGAKAAPGATATVGLAAYNGETGKELAAPEGFAGSSALTAQLTGSALLPGFVRALECLSVGSRAVVTTTAEDAFGSAYSQLGMKEKDPVVLVADLIGIPPTRADGKPVTPPAGFPTVKLAKDGEPSITIPKADPPTETRIAQLKQGSGETVLPGDTVTVQYKGVLWRNGEMFDSSWSRGAPAPLKTTGVVKGFQNALEGQTVGSQVIAIIPPADGYGEKGSGKITATDTMVFVIDILGTTR
ncbi:peptidylprolyl isomerase [Leifsonia xyli subsp. xyli]|uniref:peptidylprolyl isomerase n=1 Tax=Leifsonia xyli subsp. xyli TaxID=59736 RepID=A0A1E2SLU0_LEIXY|nr:FKBP-type peptidyl-prolyl cis-trans isomerase [Leifsonia xyli]ODA90737.1 peptidylprolyl isomerase [Leifsonia xyli subsp. xyli]